MIHPNRFVASKSVSREGWLEARRTGVTATQVARAASGPGGFEQMVEEYRADFVEADNPYMAFGRAWEGPVSMFLKERRGIMPNEWLICHERMPHHMATPDGLSMDHDRIAEIKTTGKDFNPDRLPVQYVRQVQWQLYVTGASLCVFAWMLREERDGVFLPAWFEPKMAEVKRDEELIAGLVETADRLWERVNDGAV